MNEEDGDEEGMKIDSGQENLMNNDEGEDKQQVFIRREAQ